MITIKPHHFIDIIKLFGAGIENFVPDEAFGHYFYKIANEIIRDMGAVLQLTIYGDDICKPCNRYNGNECTELFFLSGKKNQECRSKKETICFKKVVKNCSNLFNHSIRPTNINFSQENFDIYTAIIHHSKSTLEVSHECNSRIRQYSQPSL